MLIFLSRNFVSLLADAVAGKYAVNVIFGMIGYRIPEFLQLILPLGFYIAILLSYGRLYMESEMVVLFACGVSQRQLIAITLVPAALVSLLVALFSFLLSPLGKEQFAKIVDEQRNRSEFDVLNAGRFQSINQGHSITYIKEISDNHKRLEGVFIARDGNAKSEQSVLFAQSGEQIQHEEYGQRYLILKDGYQYKGQPGTADFQITRFATYGQYMAPVVLTDDYSSEMDAKPTRELLASNGNAERATLQLRLSWPVMVLIVTFLAVSFSKTNPRQGRYAKMLPAVLVFVFYYIFLTSVNTLVSTGKWPIYPGLWVVHAAFLGLAWLMFNWDVMTFKQRRRARERAAYA